jgi:hypothetical protein
MNTEKQYNGWTNYETWLVKLWIDNDEGSQSEWQDAARIAYDDAGADETFSKAERAALNLMDMLKDQHEQIIEEANVPENGFIADLLNAAMSEVNWHEIAASLIEDNCEEEANTQELGV